MNGRLVDYRMLWQAATTHAHPRLSVIIRWGVSFLAIVIGAAVGYNDGARAALAWFWSAGSAFLLLTWAWRFMPGAVKLGTPAYAKLVPQMRRRLVELSCLVCCIGLAGIASAPYADASALGGWLFWIVLLLVGAGLGTAGHPAGSALIMVGCFSSMFLEKLPPVVGATLSHPLVLLLSLPVYAGVIWIAVRTMFPEGGERHWNMLARRARWASTVGMQDPTIAQMGGKPIKRWYAASLRGASERRDGRRLMLLGLGPARHIGEWVAATGLMSAIVLAIGVLTTWRADRERMQDIGWALGCMLLFVPVLHGLSLRQLAGVHTGEQALVRLAPAMPASAVAFNGQLGRSLLRQMLASWLLAGGVALVLVALGGADAAALLRLAGVYCLALPLVALPLRDHAASGRSGVVGVLLVLLSFAADLLLAFPIGRVTGLPVMAVAALLGIATALLALRHGLRTMQGAPCAFPAGRMD